MTTNYQGEEKNEATDPNFVITCIKATGIKPDTCRS